MKLLWRLVNKRCSSIPSVIDLGAGDGRFARFGKYNRYTGYELDADRIQRAVLPINAALVARCVLDVTDYCAAAVGNPPFIRNQDLGTLWRRRARAVIYKELGEEVNPFSNLYLYFMWLAIARTTADAIVALVVPFDWTYRPSSLSLREYIARQRWSVDVFRLLGSATHFPGVKTTVCITIIDKHAAISRLRFWTVGESLSVSDIRPAEAAEARVFAYVTGRSTVYAARGFSPGSQAVFTLTEKERVQAKISRSSVLPCVTSLRGLPRSLRVLNGRAFVKHLIRGGRRCWLLKTEGPHLANGVRDWLDRAPASVRISTTCRLRGVWYRYAPPAPPQVLIASGFRAPKQPSILRNDVRARNLGSVFGIFPPRAVPAAHLLTYLRSIDFTRGTVPDARGFRRIEVRQLNGLLLEHCRDAHAKTS